MRFYKKIVVTITIFFAGVSGVFLLSGAGIPGLRILVGLIFFISTLNLTIYLREFGQWSRKVLQSAGSQLSAAGKSGKKPDSEGKPSGPPGKAKSSAEGGSRRQADGDGKGKSDESGDYE